MGKKPAQRGKVGECSELLVSNPSGTPADASPLSLHSPCFPQYTIIQQNAKAEKCILLTFASFSDLIVEKETEGKPHLKYGFPSQIVSEREISWRSAR